VLSEGTQVDIHGVDDESYFGYAPAEILRFPAIRHLINSQVFRLALLAEESGYDAFVLGSFSEPFLAELRSLVDIPVVSMAESSLLVGCSLASRLALITLAPQSIPRVVRLLGDHQLVGRVSGVYSLEPGVTEQDLIAVLNGGDPDVILSSFESSVRRAIADGADLIIPAEGALNEVLWSHGIHEVNGATVSDGLGLVTAYAELLVRLKRVSGIGASRLNSYPKATPELVSVALDLARASY
jgi:Asp/Glu/hydantoin racemase